MVRRTALEEAGGWQGRFAAMDDFHLWLRLSVHRPFLSVGAPTVGWRHRGESVSSVLRSDAVRCLRKNHDVARAGLEYRDQQGGDREPYRRRCAGFRHLADVAAAMVKTETEGIAAAACALEEATQPDPDAYIERLFHQLFWVFCQSVDPRRRRRFQQETCAQLAACWPADAPRTGAALRRLGRSRRWWRRLRAAGA